MSKWEIVDNNMLVNDDFKNDAALLLSGDWNSEEEMQNFLTDVCNKLNHYAELEAENAKLKAMKITPEMVEQAYDDWLFDPNANNTFMDAYVSNRLNELMEGK